MIHRRLFPHLHLSLAMWVMWLFLVNDFSAGHIVLGALLAWAIPYLSQAFWPEEMTVRKPWVTLRFFLILFWDIIVANFVVARLILTRRGQLQPAFMVLELELEDDFTITLLATAISISPGTVSVDLSADRRTLLVHSLHVVDVETALADIRRRYESPLKEIFECYR